MTFDEFIAKYHGVYAKYPTGYGKQCMDVYRLYVKEVLDIPQSPPVTSAYMVWEKYLPQYFNRIPNTPTDIPKKGDIMIWNTNYGKHGHIAIVVSATLMNFEVFEQNSPLGSKCHIGKHSYKSVYGWLERKQ